MEQPPQKVPDCLFAGQDGELIQWLRTNLSMIKVPQVLSLLQYLVGTNSPGAVQGSTGLPTVHVMTVPVDRVWGGWERPPASDCVRASGKLHTAGGAAVYGATEVDNGEFTSPPSECRAGAVHGSGRSVPSCRRLARTRRQRRRYQRLPASTVP